MNALVFILFKSTVNGLKELLKKPGKLTLYALIVVLIIAFTVTSLAANSYIQDTLPLFFFKGILFILIALFFAFAVGRGVSNGDAIFRMDDVNLIFVSPLSPRKILFYGRLRLTKTAFLAGFFILFQAGSLANFGIDYGGVLITLLSFMLSIIVLSIISLAVYSVTNGNPKRKLFVKIFAVLIFLPFVSYLLASLAVAGHPFLALRAAIESPFMSCVPVAGWTAAGVTAFLSGEITSGLLFFGANIALGAGLVAYTLFADSDYYEDTLVAAETFQERRSAATVGNLNASPGALRRRVKISRTGIFGFGASAFFGKHTRESFRQNLFGFLNLRSFLTAGGAVIAALFSRDLLVVLQILMWMEIILIGTERGMKETYSHFIYMAPDTSFRKILWSNAETVIRIFTEGILIFGLSGLSIGAPVAYIFAAALTYAMFSFLLLGVNYLFMRFTGANVSAGFLIVIYYLSVAVVMFPGIILSITVGVTSGAITGLLILIAWETGIATICLALSKRVLDNCDMPAVKPRA
jgi:hypothetical protein